MIFKNLEQMSVATYQEVYSTNEGQQVLRSPSQDGKYESRMFCFRRESMTCVKAQGNIIQRKRILR